VLFAVFCVFFVDLSVFGVGIIQISCCFGWDFWCLVVCCFCFVVCIVGCLCFRCAFVVDVGVCGLFVWRVCVVVW